MKEKVKYGILSSKYRQFYKNGVFEYGGGIQGNIWLEMGKNGVFDHDENLTFVYIFVKNRLYIYEKADFMPTFQF